LYTISVYREPRTRISLSTASCTSFVRAGSQSIKTFVESPYDYDIYLGYLPRMLQYFFRCPVCIRVCMPCRVPMSCESPLYVQSFSYVLLLFFSHNRHATLSSRVIMVLLLCRYPRMQISNSIVGSTSRPYLSRLGNFQRDLGRVRGRAGRRDRKRDTRSRRRGLRA
jgi:hypothetical protein